MPRKYIGHSFDALGGEHTSRAEVSLVGSHLQNICIEVEGDGVDVSVLLSPSGAAKMITAIQAAIDEIAKSKNEGRQGCT